MRDYDGEYREERDKAKQDGAAVHPGIACNRTEQQHVEYSCRQYAMANLDPHHGDVSNIKKGDKLLILHPAQGSRTFFFVLYIFDSFCKDVPRKGSGPVLQVFDAPVEWATQIFVTV